MNFTDIFQNSVKKITPPDLHKCSCVETSRTTRLISMHIYPSDPKVAEGVMEILNPQNIEAAEVMQIHAI